MTDFVKVAKAYLSNGISVHPLVEKIPTMEWELFTKKMMAIEEAEHNFKNANGIGIITGRVSGGKEGYALEVIDVDAKNFLDYEAEMLSLKTQIPKELSQKLVVAETKNKGLHIIYRAPSECVFGNRRLAARPTTPQEFESTGQKILVTYETRSNGGYICAAPSKGYRIISKNKQIPYLSPEEHMFLMDLAGSFNQVFDDLESFEREHVERNSKFITSPFDDYNHKAAIDLILVKHGWTVVSQKGEKTRLKRPGATSSSSAEYSRSKNRLKVFSTSAELEGGRSYTASEVFARMECGNDWKRAFKELLDKGFGERLSYSANIKRYIHSLKHKTILELLLERYPEGEIKGEKFIYDGKEFII